MWERAGRSETTRRRDIATDITSLRGISQKLLSREPAEHIPEAVVGAVVPRGRAVAAVEAAERILQGARRGPRWQPSLHYVTAYDRSIF
jgi:hypothetical protein